MTTDELREEIFRVREEQVKWKTLLDKTRLDWDEASMNRWKRLYRTVEGLKKEEQELTTWYELGLKEDIARYLRQIRDKVAA